MKYLNKLFIFSDIMCFYNNNIRCQNYVNNKKRELIISNIFNLPNYYFVNNNNEYATYWLNFKEKLSDSLNKIPEFKKNEFNNINFEIIQKGGIYNNYDFDINILDNNKNIKISNKLEFKFLNNYKTINNLPQFLELYDKDINNKYKIIDVNYGEYYYDNFLDEYLNLLKNKIEKPKKDIYLQFINDYQYKHPFFKNLYLEKLINTKEKENIVKLSKIEYLKKYLNNFNLNNLKDKIIESQKDKIYLIWCKKKENFYLENFNNNIENIEVKFDILEEKNNEKYKLINKSYINLYVKNYNYNIKLNLNWGNNNGICNPRWKLSFINKE